MPEEDEHVAFEFHGLVADLQRNDVVRFEQEHKAERRRRADLRASTPGAGLNAGELLKKLDGDPSEADRKVKEMLDRIDRDAKAAVEKTQRAREPMPEGSFPPPPESE